MAQSLHKLKLTLPGHPLFRVAVDSQGTLRTYIWPCGCRATTEHAERDDDMRVTCCALHVDLLEAATTSGEAHEHP